MKYLLSLLACMALTTVSSVQASALDDLLEQVKTGSLQKTKAAVDLENNFKAARGTTSKNAMVTRLKNFRASLESKSDGLEARYEANEAELNKLRSRREAELGSLKDLFGAIQQINGEAQANFETSIISSQFSGRVEKLEDVTYKLTQSNDLVTANDIRGVWTELLNEMVQQGKVVTYSAQVASPSGNKREIPVTRVGVFNLIADGKFLDYGKGGLAELPRQPEGRFLSQAKDLQSASEGSNIEFSVDPTKGILLGASVERPSIGERVGQGGLVGKVIILMGIVAFIVAIYKIFTLIMVSNNVNRQAKNVSKPSTGNPLGRILKIFKDNPKSDTEALELKLSEAIMKETPKLNSWLMFLKIVAVVAPLMGLLGTVVGMIETFQSITLFGAGDPKLMAGGISQALVTTVLGLVVAIPTVLLHTAAASKAKRVQEILEEQSAGMVARQVERS